MSVVSPEFRICAFEGGISVGFGLFDTKGTRTLVVWKFCIVKLYRGTGSFDESMLKCFHLPVTVSFFALIMLR